MRVAIAMTVTAADVAQALVIAWQSFRRSAGADIEDWDVDRASVEVKPEDPLGVDGRNIAEAAARTALQFPCF